MEHRVPRQQQALDNGDGDDVVREGRAEQQALLAEVRVDVELLKLHF